MNLDRFDLNLLVAFEALLTEGQVTRAARRLHITQPALSGALARLRVVFGDQLFVKDGKSMRPTLRARELAVPIREALEKVRQAVVRPAFAPKTSAVSVRIATSDDLELTLIARVLKRLRSEAPNMKLVIRRVTGLFELPTQELVSGALDMAIGAFPQGPHHPSGVIVSAPLYVDHLVCVVREGHPTIKRTLSQAQFQEASHVVVYYPPEGMGIVDQLLFQRGAQRRKVAMEVPHYFTAAFAVGQTDLIASIDAKIAAYLRRAAGVRVLPFPFESPKLNFGLYWHGRQTADPAHTWLREVIIEAAQERKSQAKA
ncbi:MAG TPA: LysR family transcriptional regulator [Steroidobacteraceae bacterium]|nr:LysR family transcriptional regulator [Steroidobacteraceae bacterium]